jgi:hypothetical protein
VFDNTWFKNKRFVLNVTEEFIIEQNLEEIKRLLATLSLHLKYSNLPTCKINYLTKVITFDLFDFDILYPYKTTENYKFLIEMCIYECFGATYCVDKFTYLFKLLLFDVYVQYKRANLFGDEIDYGFELFCSDTEGTDEDLILKRGARLEKGY